MEVQAKTDQPDGFLKGAGAEIGWYVVAGLIITLVSFVIYSRSLLKLLGLKRFIIIIAATVILNSIASFVSSCFGTKDLSKKENFSSISLIVFILIMSVIVGSMFFSYYIIKRLGFERYLILITVLSIISAISGYKLNCM